MRTFFIVLVIFFHTNNLYSQVPTFVIRNSSTITKELRKDIKNADRKLKNRDLQIKSLENNVRWLNNKIEELQKEINANSEKITSLTTENIKLQKRVLKLEEKISTSNFEKLNNTNDLLINNNIKKDTIIAELNKKLAEQEQNRVIAITKLQEELKKSKDENLKLQEIIKNLTLEVQLKNSEISVQNNKLNKLEKEIIENEQLLNYEIKKFAVLKLKESIINFNQYESYVKYGNDWANYAELGFFANFSYLDTVFMVDKSVSLYIKATDICKRNLLKNNSDELECYEIDRQYRANSLTGNSGYFKVLNSQSTDEKDNLKVTLFLKNTLNKKFSKRKNYQFNIDFILVYDGSVDNICTIDVKTDSID